MAGPELTKGTERDADEAATATPADGTTTAEKPESAGSATTSKTDEKPASKEAGKAAEDADKAGDKASDEAADKSGAKSEKDTADDSADSADEKAAADAGKADDKAQDKADEKAEEKAADKAEDKAETPAEDKAGAEDKAEDKAAEETPKASVESVSEPEPAAEAGTEGGHLPLLQVENLRVHLNTPRGLLKAVDGVSFTIERGATLGLVGESGSGKSMLVRSLMGISPGIATIKGSVKLDGQELVDLPRKQARQIWGNRIAMVFQDPMTSLNPVVRIERQLTESMRLHLNISKAEAKERAVDMLKLVGIPEPLKRSRQYPHQLSGGMRQRVTIAMALGCDPDLLIADEATTALDVTVQRQILDLLQEIQAERGMGMILVSHDLGVVAGRTNEIAVMYAGRMVEHAKTNELFATRRHRYTEALLGAVPRLDVPKTQRPKPIPGTPPDLITLKSGCAFAARCSAADDLCREVRPELSSGAGDAEHSFACHHPVGDDLVGVGAADAPTLTKEVSA